jgi:hypothetical protein
MPELLRLVTRMSPRFQQRLSQLADNTRQLSRRGFLKSHAIPLLITVVFIRRQYIREYAGVQGLVWAPDPYPPRVRRGSLLVIALRLCLTCVREGEHRGLCLYTQQGVRIICGEDRKNEQSDMTWVKRFIVFLVVGFALFYLIAYPEAAANAVRAVLGGLAIVFRSILIFFESLAS